MPMFHEEGTLLQIVENIVSRREVGELILVDDSPTIVSCRSLNKRMPG
jgi:hypothetical protein